MAIINIQKIQCILSNQYREGVMMKMTKWRNGNGESGNEENESESRKREIMWRSVAYSINMTINILIIKY